MLALCVFSIPYKSARKLEADLFGEQRDQAVPVS
jgi:hypothetical protein